MVSRGHPLTALNTAADLSLVLGIINFLAKFRERCTHVVPETPSELSKHLYLLKVSLLGHLQHMSFFCVFNYAMSSFP